MRTDQPNRSRARTVHPYHGWRTAVLLCLLLAGAEAVAEPVGRQVLRVGPGHDLATPSAAARVARDGALIEIEGGDYHGDVAVWRQHRLRLRGVNGRPHLHAGGQAAERKAIWVIKGNDIEIENIEFSGCRVPDRNGAGIRAEGAGLSIRRSAFHDNEMGILTSPNANSVLMIIDSDFYHNTVDHQRHRRLGHNIYVGAIHRFVLSGSRVWGAETGHQVKTRARRNDIVGNRIRDNALGSSYLIDIANGGQALISDNELHQSEHAPNRTAIAYAPEGNKYVDGAALEVSNNRFRSDGRPALFVRNHSEVEVRLRNNQLSGLVTPLRGPGSVE